MPSNVMERFGQNVGNRQKQKGRLIITFLVHMLESLMSYRTQSTKLTCQDDLPFTRRLKFVAYHCASACKTKSTCHQALPQTIIFCMPLRSRPAPTHRCMLLSSSNRQKHASNANYRHFPLRRRQEMRMHLYPAEVFHKLVLLHVFIVRWLLGC